MTKDKLFRETPFNGYNRNDVLDYLIAQDKKNVSEREEKQTRINELQAENEALADEKIKLNAIIEQLNFAVEEKSKAFDELNAEYSDFKAQKEGEIAVLQKRIELAAPSDSLTAENGELRGKLSVITAKVEELNEKNTELETQVRSYIEKICTYQSQQQTRDLTPELEAAKNEIEEKDKKISSLLSEIQASAFQENGSTTENCRLKAELEAAERAIAERDEKIAFIQRSWEQYKKDYSRFSEVNDSASAILDNANKEAEAILQEAQEQAKAIIDKANSDKEEAYEKSSNDIQYLITNAIKESGRIVSAAQEQAKQIILKASASATTTKEKLLLLKDSVSGITSNIDFAVMSITDEDSTSAPKPKE